MRIHLALPLCNADDTGARTSCGGDVGIVYFARDEYCQF